MKKIVRNLVVKKDIKTVVENESIEWGSFINSRVLITGCTGCIGSFLTHVFLRANKVHDLKLKVIGLVRDKKSAKQFFGSLANNKALILLQGDVTREIDYGSRIDYIFHCANNTSSKSFVETPVETMDVAFNGTKNVLEFAKRKKIKSMVHLSSIEVYGKVEQNDKLLKEEDLGYLDLYNVRNSYPIAKRAAEALCNAYATEKKVPVKIARLAQIVGSNIGYDNSRVLAYFARNAVERKDIVLKTSGNDIRSYCYITDVITALITMLHKGQDGNTYNVANEQSTCSIRQIAEEISDKFEETNVSCNIDAANLYPEKANWPMEASKLRSLGWQPTVNREQMFDKLIQSFYRQKNSAIEPPRKQI